MHRTYAAAPMPMPNGGNRENYRWGNLHVVVKDKVVNIIVPMGIYYA
jgi:hypothetical protein